MEGGFSGGKHCFNGRLIPGKKREGERSLTDKHSQPGTGFAPGVFSFS